MKIENLRSIKGKESLKKDIILDDISVEYIKYGIACRIGNKIYLNERLKSIPELHRAILSHEIRHTSGFTLTDLMMDINNKYLKRVKREYYKFILRNPSSWIEFLPICRYNKRWTINPLILFVYIFSYLLVRWIWGRLI